MKKKFIILIISLLLPLFSFSNKIVGTIGKKGVNYHFNEEKLIQFFTSKADFSSVTSISIKEENGTYALHVLGYDLNNKKVLVVKELKKENNKLIITEKNDNTYLLSKHLCTGTKKDDNEYEFNGGKTVKCDCKDRYSRNIYNHIITTSVNFDYLDFYNAF